MKQKQKRPEAYNDDIKEEKNTVVDLLNKFLAESDNKAFIQPILENLNLVLMYQEKKFTKL